MNPKDVAVKFRDLAAAVPGIKRAFEYDADDLGQLPVVTLSLARTEPVDRYTGPAQDMTWTWIVRLYLPFGGRVAGDDRETLDDLQYDLLPRLFKVVRDDQSIGGTCVKATLSDVGDEPDPELDAGYAVKLLELRALTEEV